jgi:hypothetical protein
VLLLAAATDSEPGSWLEVVRERGAESCPGARELGGAVEGELGQPDPIEGRRVHCVVSRKGGGWRARITIDGDGGATAVRTIRAQGASCRPLAAALELTLALALATAAEPAPALPVPQVMDDEQPEGLAAHPAQAVARSPWSASAGAVLSRGALLNLSAGLELGGRWRRGRLLLALEARGERALPADADQGPATVEGWRASGALVPCLLAPAGIQLCSVARAGGFTVRSEGLAVSRSGQGWLAEAGGRVAWRLGGDGLALALYAEATAPLVRTRLLVDAQPSWASPPVVFSFGVAAMTGQ